jgi:hypothetical protein
MFWGGGYRSNDPGAGVHPGRTVRAMNGRLSGPGWIRWFCGRPQPSWAQAPASRPLAMDAAAIRAPTGPAGPASGCRFVPGPPQGQAGRRVGGDGASTPERCVYATRSGPRGAAADGATAGGRAETWCRVRRRVNSAAGHATSSYRAETATSEPRSFSSRGYPVPMRADVGPPETSTHSRIFGVGPRSNRCVHATVTRLATRRWSGRARRTATRLSGAMRQSGGHAAGRRPCRRSARIGPRRAFVLERVLWATARGGRGVAVSSNA